jgi:hypothetical protein
MHRAALALAVVLCPLAQVAGGAEIRTISGESRAELVTIARTAKGLEVVTRDGRIPADQVREVRLRQADLGVAGAATRVFLRNGDELAGEIASGDVDGLTVRTAALGQVELPLDLVRESDLSRFRREVLPRDPERDEVVLRTWLRRSGGLESITPEGVQGEWDGLGMASFGPDNALGVRLAPLGPLEVEITAFTVQLELTDGSVISGELLRLEDGRGTLRLPSTAEAEVKLADVVAMWFPGGRFAYVSDLQPADVEERAQLISVVFPHRRDAAVLGGPLALGGRTYRKGLGVHAYTRLTYDLAGGYQTLRAVIGLDDGARDARTVSGTVVFQVLADGKPMLGEEGIALRTESPPRPIEVPLAGVDRLELIADFGDSGDTLARGAWADAFLVRKP